ncbi:MAG TPA: TonB-dependent receptor [Terriglobia bacterium]|nr:TonB-dependent receptor [Terriglobia bacterium]
MLSVCALAPTSAVGATLEGIVTDSSGAPVPDAEVHVRNVDTNQSRHLATDERGSFRAPDLAVGTYQVAVEHAGFASYRHTGVVLLVGQTTRLSIELAPAALKQQVTVSAQPTPLSPSETTMTSTIDNERIEEGPVRSRNYLDFVLLAPGVAAANPSSASGSAAPLAASGFSFGGLRARSNSVSIDGLDNNDEYTGSSRTELSLEIVREFQVVNNGLSSEFGGASGGSINVVTKTGTNLFHGDDFVFLQSGALDAREPFQLEPQKPDLTRYRVGSSLGGPIRKDKTFFYAAWEQESSRGQDESFIQPGVANAVNAVLQSGLWTRLGTKRITSGFFPTARSETEASAKLNQNLSDRYSLMLRYAFTNNKEAGDAFSTGALTDPSGRGSGFTNDQGLAGSLVALVGTHRVNDLRFQLARRQVTLRTGDALGPEIDINGLANFGRPYLGNGRRHESHDEISDTLAVSKSVHLIKVGATVNHVSLDTSLGDGFGGVYIFPSLRDFASGQADSFRQAFGTPDASFGVTSYGLFGQDHWSVTPRLTLDLGARYDFEQLPRGFHPDHDDFSPRVGVAYSPSSVWVLRAGFGLFYDRYVLANLNRAIVKDGVRSYEQTADGAAATAIFTQNLGGPLSAPLAGIQPSIFRADPNLEKAYSAQTSTGVERLLGPNLTLSADYLFVRGLKLGRTRNVNLLPPVVLTPDYAGALGIVNPMPQQLGRDFFGPGRLDPRFNDVYQLEDSASSTYRGLSVALNRRLADEVEFSAGYTLSKTTDDASDFDEQPQNPFNLAAERGLSRNHQEQRLVFSGTFDLPFGEDEDHPRHGAAKPAGSRLLDDILGHVELAPIVTLESGRPVDPLTGLDSNRADAFPLSSRPLGFSRNSLSTPGLATIDLRVVKYIPFGGVRHLDFVVESFNLLNRTNVREINPFFGSGSAAQPGFGLPLDTFNPRQLQFSLDFEF